MRPYAEAFPDLGKEVEDKSSKGLWYELLKHTFLSSNCVITVAEKHFGTLLLALFSITTILIRRKSRALMSKLPSNTDMRPVQAVGFSHFGSLESLVYTGSPRVPSAVMITSAYF